jgi:ABC-2 type transport system ATP-binding protein
MTGEAAALSVEGLTVRYGARTALDGVSFEVPRGSVFALLGRNGAGKSSLVRCALGLQKPAQGAVRLFGENVWVSRCRAMARVGVVPEEPDAPPDMTAGELLAFCAPLYPSWDAAASRARLERADVPLRTPFGRLSKGQKGAVMLALALAPAPELLVLDDPTLGLDVVARQALYEELVGELAERGTTVFLTTHDLSGIEPIASRVAVLKEGKLVLDEDAEVLKSRFRRIRYGNRATETRTEYGTELDAFDAVRVRVRGWGVDAIVSNYEETSFERFCETDGVEDAEAAAMSLEEIFVAVAGEERGEGS